MPPSRPQTRPCFAYLADGRLFVQRSEGAAAEITSPFGEAALRRAREAPSDSPSEDEPVRITFDPTTRVWFTGLTRGAEPGSLVYSLYLGGTALCALSAEGEEARLFHAPAGQLAQVARDDVGGRLVAASRDAKGAHLALFRDDGREKQILTEDDGIDAEPCFERSAEGLPRGVIYQRRDRVFDAKGHLVDITNAALWRVDLETRETTLIARDDAYECVAPQTTADGTRYHLRIPWQGPLPPTVWENTTQALSRAFLFAWEHAPGRLGLEPPAWAFPPPPRFAPLLADERWVLVKTQHGQETIVATGVAAYDLHDDGRILITDGQTIRVSSPSGARSAPLAEGEEITVVRWIEVPTGEDSSHDGKS